MIGALGGVCLGRDPHGTWPATIGIAPSAGQDGCYRDSDSEGHTVTHAPQAVQLSAMTGRRGSGEAGVLGLSWMQLKGQATTQMPHAEHRSGSSCGLFGAGSAEIAMGVVFSACTTCMLKHIMDQGKRYPSRAF